MLSLNLASIISRKVKNYTVYFFILHVYFFILHVYFFYFTRILFCFLCIFFNFNCFMWGKTAYCDYRWNLERNTKNKN